MLCCALGITTVGSGFVTNTAGLIGCRAVLGFFEAGIVLGTCRGLIKKECADSPRDRLYLLDQHVLQTIRGAMAHVLVLLRGHPRRGVL